MPEVSDFFAKNYPQFVSISTTALVCWFVFRFYLKAEGFSKEWTDFKTIYFPKFEERFVSLTKEMNDRFASLIEKMDERFAESSKKMDERFASLTKEMNERFARP